MAKAEEKAATTEEMQAEIERLRAELAKVNAAPEADADGEEMMDFVLPMNGTDERPLFVCVNGQNIRIRRGETVRIKRKYYEAIRNAREQEMAAYHARLAMQANGRKALAEL